MEHMVSVGGVPHPVILRQRGKTVWHAVGIYMDKRLTVQAASAEAALKAWRRAAEYRLLMITADASADRTDCVVTGARATRPRRT